MATVMTSLPRVTGRHHGRHAIAVAIRYMEPGWFVDGKYAVLIMYTDQATRSEPLTWVPKDEFMPDHRIEQR